MLEARSKIKWLSFLANMEVSELERLAQKNLDKRITEFAGGRLAAKRAFCRMYGYDETKLDDIWVRNEETGAPSIHKHPKCVVTISHSYDVAVALVAEFPIGIDVEKAESRPAALLKYYYHPEEKKAYQAWAHDPKQQEELVTLWWTRKEAISKYLTLGSRMILRKMNTIPDIYVHENPPAEIRLISELVNGYAVTIAV